MQQTDQIYRQHRLGMCSARSWAWSTWRSRHFPILHSSQTLLGGSRVAYSLQSYALPNPCSHLRSLETYGLPVSYLCVHSGYHGTLNNFLSDFILYAVNPDYLRSVALNSLATDKQYKQEVLSGSLENYIQDGTFLKKFSTRVYLYVVKSSRRLRSPSEKYQMNSLHKCSPPTPHHFLKFLLVSLGTCPLYVLPPGIGNSSQN